MIHGASDCSVVFRNDLVNGNIFENEMYFTWDVDFDGLYNSYLKHLLTGVGGGTSSGREADMTKLSDDFRNFANAPKKVNHYTDLKKA
jgi:hypothetical protein